MWNQVRKLCFVYLFQAGKRNFFTSYSQNLGSILLLVDLKSFWLLSHNECISDDDCRGLGKKVGPRLCECCRQSQAEVVNNSMTITRFWYMLQDYTYMVYFWGCGHSTSCYLVYWESYFGYMIYLLTLLYGFSWYMVYFWRPKPRSIHNREPVYYMGSIFRQKDAKSHHRPKV